MRANANWPRVDINLCKQGAAAPRSPSESSMNNLKGLGQMMNSSDGKRQSEWRLGVLLAVMFGFQPAGRRVPHCLPLPRKVTRTLALCLRPDWKWERAGTLPPCGCHRVSRQLNERAASLTLGDFNWRSLTCAPRPSRPTRLLGVPSCL